MKQTKILLPETDIPETVIQRGGRPEKPADA